MKESLLPLSKRLLVWGIAGVAFVTPLLLTTSTVDPFEFPKQTFLYAAVLVLLALWLARFFLQGEVRIRKTPLDLPLLLFLGVVIVSTVLSYNQVGLVGFFGFFGRFQGGMLSILAAVLLYYIAVSNLDEREDVARVIWAVVAAGTILAVIGLTNALGFPLLSFPEAQGRTFSLTGALSSMSVYLAATLLLIFGMLLRINQAKGPERSRGVVHEFRIRLPGTHRGRGRPKGMKNKNTLEKEALLQKEQPAAERQAEGPERSRRAETFWSEGQGKKDEGEKKEGATLLVMLSRFFNRGSETLKIRSLREDQVQGDRRRPTLWIPPAWVILVVSGSLIAGQLALLNHPAAWAVLIAGSVVLLFWNRPSVLLPSARFISIILSVGLVVFLSVHVVGLGKVVPQVQPLEKEHTLDMLSSWGVAALTVRDYPLFGSGPGTFLFDFTRYRPTSFNETQYWNLRFTAPHNEYFLYLTTFGIIGLFGFAVFVIRFVIFALGTALKGNEKENHPLKVSVIATAVGLFVGMAFTAYSTTPFVLLFLVLAVGMALERLLSGAWSEDLRISLSLAQAERSEVLSGVEGLRRPREVMPTIFFYPGIALVVFAFYFLSRNIQANVAYTASLAAAGRNDGTA
ncbi:MAG: O-antigen ligase family protein, partial [bacterium]|nr:O-antigen ligase family protein [bacterium]